MNNRGFTLVELIITIILIGVLAVTAIPRFLGSNNEDAYTLRDRTLAMIRSDLAEPGTQVELLWGEADGGSAKPHVEEHRQVRIKAEVQPWPIHSASREKYRKQV